MSLACSPAASAQVYAEQVLNIGRNVLAMDDYVLAIQYFNQATQAKPYLWDPYYYRALAKLMLDDYHGAEADASQAIERNKYKYEAYRVRGFARMRLGNDSAAIADFDRGLEYAPGDKYFLYYKGGAQASMKAYEEADSTLSRLLREYPGFEEGYNTRAQTHLMAGDTLAAISDIDKALAINSNMLQPRLMKAEIALRQRRWADAAGELDSVIRLQPSDVSLYINRAYARYNADDWPGAMEDYNYALSIDPESYAALYNRALLRYQVQDLRGALADFSAVLLREPDDFPARYNRGLINLDLGAYRQALADFNLIAQRYPRFYPVYYAISRAQQGLGNNKAAADNFFKANDLITRYTSNPAHYKLDRPTIQEGSTRRQESEQQGSSDAPEDVMEHFNELVTISQEEQNAPVYGEKLRGRVQDIDRRVEPEGPFSLTLIDPTDELRPRSGTYSELTDINASGWINEVLYLSNVALTPADPEALQEIFERIESISRRGDKLRPVDLLERAVAYAMVKNYSAAIADLNNALKRNPEFVSALLQRAFTRIMLAHTPHVADEGAPGSVDAVAAKQGREAEVAQLLREAMEDYDKALQIDPNLTYALLGKAYLLYSSASYAEAEACLDMALKIDANFGAALFNRALCKLSTGRKAEAQADLSRAGAAGVVQAYNLLKKL